MASKPKHERLLIAETRGNSYLADANLAAERGDMLKAERLYAKGQVWLDRANSLAGNGE